MFDNVNAPSPRNIINKIHSPYIYYLSFIKIIIQTICRSQTCPLKINDWGSSLTVFLISIVGDSILNLTPSWSFFSFVAWQLIHTDSVIFFYFKLFGDLIEDLHKIYLLPVYASNTDVRIQTSTGRKLCHTV